MLSSKQIEKDISDAHESIMRCCGLVERPVESSSPLEIVIKPDMLDTTGIQEGEGNKNIYRPETFSQYIGQESAKNKLINRIEGTKKLNEKMDHVFISGSAGCGKTTLAYIIAKQFGVKFVETVGGNLRNEQMAIDKIMEAEGGIVFLDEIHKLNNKVGNFLLPVIEDFQVCGKKIKPFTLIGATTEAGELLKHLAPFVMRFPVKIELEDYRKEDLIFILKQYHSKKYNHISISDDIFNIVADNCKNTPRIGLALLKDYICSENINTVLSDNGIVKEGFTIKDIKVLNYLNDKPKGVSQATISAFMGLSLQNYKFEIENWLIKNDMIEIQNKRRISDIGKNFLKTLEG